MNPDVKQGGQFEEGMVQKSQKGEALINKEGETEKSDYFRSLRKDKEDFMEFTKQNQDLLDKYVPKWMKVDERGEDAYERLWRLIYHQFYHSSEIEKLQEVDGELEIQADHHLGFYSVDESEKEMAENESKYNKKVEDVRKYIRELDSEYIGCLNENGWLMSYINGSCREGVSDQGEELHLTGLGKFDDFLDEKYDPEGEFKIFRLGRIYLNVKPDLRPTIYQSLVEEIYHRKIQADVKIPYTWKEKDLLSSDKTVIYFEEGDEEEILDAVEEVYSNSPDSFRNVIPRLTAQVRDSDGMDMAGISFAEEPFSDHRDKDSFGTRRSKILARVVLNAVKSQKNIYDNEFHFDESFQAECRRKSVNTDIPVFNDGSQLMELYEEHLPAIKMNSFQEAFPMVMERIGVDLDQNYNG